MASNNPWQLTRIVCLLSIIWIQISALALPVPHPESTTSSSITAQNLPRTPIPGKAS